MNKFEMVRIGGDGVGKRFTRVWAARLSVYLLNTLGSPLGAKFKDAKSWEPVVNLFERRLARWKRNFLRREANFNQGHFC